MVGGSGRPPQESTAKLRAREDASKLGEGRREDGVPAEGTARAKAWRPERPEGAGTQGLGAGASEGLQPRPCAGSRPRAAARGPAARPPPRSQPLPARAVVARPAGGV